MIYEYEMGHTSNPDVGACPRRWCLSQDAVPCLSPVPVPESAYATT